MNSKVGYWGPVTSSVDWCEENYKHSYYIAEFWNTISSFAMVGLGLLGVILHHKSLGSKLSFAYVLIIVVGIGSVLFHATLQFQHQMWDELPMVWCGTWLFYVLIDEFGYRGSIYAIGAILYCLFATFVTSMNGGITQFIMFQTSFGLVMWSDLYFAYKLYKQVTSNQVIGLFHKGTEFLLLAISVWLFDSNLCIVFNYVPNPQLHAWWHILMCAALHCFFTACGHETVIRRGDKAEINYSLNFIPYVQIAKPKKNN